MDEEQLDKLIIDIYFEVTKGEERVPRHGWGNIHSHYLRITKQQTNLLQVQNTVRRILKSGKYEDYIKESKKKFITHRSAQEEVPIPISTETRANSRESNHNTMNNLIEQVAQVPINLSLMARVKKEMKEAINIFTDKEMIDWPKTYKIPRNKLKFDIIKEIN